MKKLLIVIVLLSAGFVFFAFTQKTSEKNIVMIRVFESCDDCGGVGRIIVSGDGAEKITQLEKWDEKSPETNTNLELIRYNIRTYVEAGYKIVSFVSHVVDGQEITTYVMIKE
jgi:hypothetical protein